MLVNLKTMLKLDVDGVIGALTKDNKVDQEFFKNHLLLNLQKS